MDNEEKEDLLVQVTEESESEVSDGHIHDKIIGLLETDSLPHRAWSHGLILVISSILLFISSTVALISLPVYIEQSNRSQLTLYSKISTLSTVTFVLFTCLYVVNKGVNNLWWCCPKISRRRFHMCLPKVFQTSLVLLAGTWLLFSLSDSNAVSCHLQDPLKGCVVVFALVFYFLFSKTKMSVEQVFCGITVIVGTFVTVDFGLCDRYRCRGADLSAVPDTSLSLHAVYVLAYLLALAAFTFHLICLENCCSCYNNYSSSLDVSIVSSEGGVASLTPVNPSLSVISGRPRPLNISLVAPFPVTSTPNEGEELCGWGACHWLAVHHFVGWALVACLCWVPTLGLSDKEPKLLVEVLDEVAKSFECHISGTGNGCSSLWLPSVLLVTSYFLLSISSVVLLMTSRSTLIVVCVMMNALPMTSLFWSLYHLDASNQELLSFQPSVSGETVSAMLGFPIIGVGTLLLVKSHVTQPFIHLSMQS